MSAKPFDATRIYSIAHFSLKMQALRKISCLPYTSNRVFPIGIFIKKNNSLSITPRKPSSWQPGKSLTQLPLDGNP